MNGDNLKAVLDYMSRSNMTVIRARVAGLELTPWINILPSPFQIRIQPYPKPTA